MTGFGGFCPSFHARGRCRGRCVPPPTTSRPLPGWVLPQNKGAGLGAAGGAALCMAPLAGGPPSSPIGPPTPSIGRPPLPIGSPAPSIGSPGPFLAVQVPPCPESLSPPPQVCPCGPPWGRDAPRWVWGLGFGVVVGLRSLSPSPQRQGLAPGGARSPSLGGK